MLERVFSAGGRKIAFSLVRVFELARYGMRNRQHESGNLHIHLPNLCFDIAEDGMFAQGPQIRVPGEPLEIAIAERERLIEGAGGHVDFTRERVTAGEIIKHERITGFKTRQLLIHLETLLEFPALSVVVAEELKGFDVIGIAPYDSLHELNFYVEVPRLLAGHFLSGTALFRHTTIGLFPR